MMNKMLLAVMWLLLGLTSALAQSKPSECLAIAMAQPRIHLAALKSDEAQITYVGHSTFVIESPGGIRAATDYSGFAGAIVPDVVTMNRAHSSHYTDAPDPAIKHVLRGWSDVAGERADHDVSIGDMRIRNVTTDIRSGGTSRIVDGNSIFVFETGGLCIGHLGHLHHELTPALRGWIGRLDVVMVPVDGGMTLPVENMISVLKDLNVRVILPMHARFAGSLERFTAAARGSFEVKYLSENVMITSTATLPNTATVFVMPNM